MRTRLAGGERAGLTTKFFWQAQSLQCVVCVESIVAYMMVG